MLPYRLKLSDFSCIIVIGFVILTTSSAQYHEFLSIKGDYCGIRGTGSRCCDGRLDACAMPIEGTLCYCDQFCNRTASSDCCPDYWEVCLGIRPPQELVKDQKCYFKEETIEHEGTIKHNCNVCSCKLGTLTCEQDRCLIDKQLLDDIEDNKGSLGWTAKNYSSMWNKKLDESLLMMTGTLPPDAKSMRMHPIKLHYDLDDIPKNFDARKKWPNLSGVRDQGWCGSSWAFSTISVAQDRLTIASQGTERVEWSTQNLISCNKRGQQACNGGHVERAWGYLRKIGVVTEDCYPYVSGTTDSKDKCKIHHKTTLQSVDCSRKQFPMDRTELYTTEPAYRIASKEGDIMWEIMTNGPVQALMRVYQDFFAYGHGIYSRSSVNGKKFGLHSVKLVGWGEENDSLGSLAKYWLAANSWGGNWGERGMFKIKRGTNESDIEQFILAVRSRRSTESNEISSKRKRFSRKIRKHNKGHF